MFNLGIHMVWVRSWGSAWLPIYLAHAERVPPGHFCLKIVILQVPRCIVWFETVEGEEFEVCKTCKWERELLATLESLLNYCCNVGSYFVDHHHTFCNEESVLTVSCAMLLWSCSTLSEMNCPLQIICSLLKNFIDSLFVWTSPLSIPCTSFLSLSHIFLAY